MENTQQEWRRIDSAPNDVTIETKIDDGHGIRNQQSLKLVGGRLWFYPDGSMYVYYTPTHWRPLSLNLPKGAKS
jgi:hypothetical protein